MSLTEFDDDEFKRICREDGIAEGQELGRIEKAVGAAKGMLIKNYPINDICEITGLSLEKVRELAESIAVKV